MTELPETAKDAAKPVRLDEALHREQVLSYIRDMSMELSLLAEQVGAVPLSDALRKAYQKARALRD